MTAATAFVNAVIGTDERGWWVWPGVTGATVLLAYIARIGANTVSGAVATALVPLGFLLAVALPALALVLILAELTTDARAAFVAMPVAQPTSGSRRMEERA